MIFLVIAETVFYVQILNWIRFFHSSSNHGAFGPFSGGFLNIASNGCVVQAPRRPIRSKRENGRKIALNQSWVTQSICRKNLLFAHNYNLNQNIVDAGIGKFKRNIFEKLLRNFSNFNLICVIELKNALSRLRRLWHKRRLSISQVYFSI